MTAKQALCVLLLAITPPASAKVFRFKQPCLKDLVAQVPTILATQDARTGRFGTGIWIVTDQNVLLPLAVAWSYRAKNNPCYHDRKVLDSIIAGGDALIRAQDNTGQWVFRKKDGSVWGKIYMPWTYFRWITAFSLVHEAMPAASRLRWEKALRLGFSGIDEIVSGADARSYIKNIQTTDATALFLAGEVFHNAGWRRTAIHYLHKACAAQKPDGYWTEHSGPVMQYGFVYMDALGTYFAASKDEAVLPVLRRGAIFYSHFTYPDGSLVETIDERNPYDPAVKVPNVGFTFSAQGRGYLEHQWSLLTGPLTADQAASLLLWGEEGNGVSPASDSDYVLPSGEAAARRRGPWFLVASAFTASLSPSRWIQDRQNFVSVFHDGLGLLIGGGNTKLQPRWSNFTAGDVDAWSWKPSEKEPDFFPPPGLLYIPSRARLLRDNDFGVELDYDGHQGRITLNILGPNKLEYSYSGDPKLTAHITIPPRPPAPLLTALQGRIPLTGKPVNLEPGSWLEYSGLRMDLPAGTTVRWPVRRFNPYKKDGSSSLEDARIVVDAPASGTHVIRLQCLAGKKANP